MAFLRRKYAASGNAARTREVSAMGKTGGKKENAIRNGRAYFTLRDLLSSGIFIIAEAGSNHDGNRDKAVEMVWKAKEAGADAIKFQDYRLDILFAPKHYSKVLGLDGEGWKKTIDTLSFKADWYETVYHAAHEAGILCFGTPFSLEAVDRLDRHAPFYKVASGDITYIPLLDHIGSKGKGVFISTGGSTPAEIDSGVQTLKKYDLPFVCIMHCIMLYPPPPDSLDLRFIRTIRERWGDPVGFSDHTRGIDAALLATGAGISALEKHFTLDCNREDGDHPISLDPDGMAELVERIREAEHMLGSSERVLTEGEALERIYARRGIYASRTIKAGELITIEMLSFLRPNTDLSAEEADNIIGGKAIGDIPAGTPLQNGMIERV